MDRVRVTYLLAVPLQMTVEEGLDEPGGLPKRLGNAPRVPELSSIAVGKYVATIRRSDADIQPVVPQASSAELVLRGPAQLWKKVRPLLVS